MDIHAMGMDEIWTVIEERMNANPEPFGQMDVLYSFDLKGDDGGAFALQLKDGATTAITGETSKEADCNLSMSVKDFKKLLLGDLNATGAFMMGKLKVKGNIGLALKLENLLKSYSF